MAEFLWIFQADCQMDYIREIDADIVETLHKILQNNAARNCFATASSYHNLWVYLYTIWIWWTSPLCVIKNDSVDASTGILLRVIFGFVLLFHQTFRFLSIHVSTVARLFVQIYARLIPLSVRHETVETVI